MRGLKLHPSRPSRRTIGTALLLAFLSCTQQNPMDPTASLSGRLSFLRSMSAAPSRLQTGGQSSLVTVQVLDETGAAVSGGTVAFASSLGTINPASAKTDANGWARTTLTSGTASGSAQVTASFKTFATATTVEFYASSDTSGFVISIHAASDAVLANGTDRTDLAIQLIPRGTQSPSGKIISLSTTAGSVPSSVVVDGAGAATVSLVSQSGVQDVTATVTATYEQQAAYTNVLMKGIRFRFEAFPLTLFADGASEATLRASLTETSTNIGISGEPVRFGTTLGTVQAERNTDGAGVAEVKLVSGTAAGTATVVAHYGSGFRDTVLVTFRESLYTVTPTASPKSILADGLSASVISVLVRDQSGRPIKDKSVYFATSAGDIDYVAITNGAGTAEATLVSTAETADRTATVTVTVDDVSKTVPVVFRGIRFSLSATPNFIVADGASRATITASVRETTSRTGVPQASVQFGTNLGTIPGLGVTDNSGIATALLTSATVQGTAEIVGRYGNQFRDTVRVQFGNSVQPGIQQIVASPGYILANGADIAYVSAKVVDAGNSPVSGAAVNFAATAGSIPSQALTGTNGVATVVLTASESTTDVTSVVSASVGNQTVTTNVVFEGVQMTIGALPTVIQADGRSQAAITVVLKRTTSKIAVPGAAVEFATDMGTIPNTASTTSEGVARVFLTSGTTTGTAHVTALYGTTIRAATTVSFQESVPTYLDVSTTPPVLPADGTSQSTIKATISDQNRSPVSDGTLVLFEIVSGSGTIERQKSTNKGIATTTLTAGTTPGVTVIRITSGSLSASTSVTYTVGEPSQVLLTTDTESMAADGMSVANLQARVLDGQGNPVSGQTVKFTASLGDVTPDAATNSQGIAVAQFSSGAVGTATVTAAVTKPSGGTVTGAVIIRLLPGSSNSITLRFNPVWIGVKDTGQNQTMTVYSDIKDAKNNPVEDGTLVRFSFIGSNLGCAFSTAQSIPTVGGTAQISITSGTVAGSIRIKATVVDPAGNPVSPAISATSTYLLVHAGPPYIEDIDDLTTTHLTVAATRLNIWSTLDTTTVSILVGDRYNNPVEQNTAVYLTTSGGVISTHTAYTDKLGRARVLLQGGNPQPTIDRFYNYTGMQDPNTHAVLTGFVWYDALGQYLLPNYDAYPESAAPGESYPGIVTGRIMNTEGDLMQNDGIARIMASTEGMDSGGASALAWDQTAVVMSSFVRYADNSTAVSASKGGTLYVGETATIRFELIDPNGNPIESGTDITASLSNGNAQAALSWETFSTGNGQGTCYYYVTLSNAIDPINPKPASTGITITWKNTHQTGAITTSGQFYIAASNRP
jgi:adhesin/invasin